MLATTVAPSPIRALLNVPAAWAETAGDLGRAVPLYEATLADSERVLGPDITAPPCSRNNVELPAGPWTIRGRS